MIPSDSALPKKARTEMVPLEYALDQRLVEVVHCLLVAVDSHDGTLSVKVKGFKGATTTLCILKIKRYTVKSSQLVVGDVRHTKMNSDYCQIGEKLSREE